MSRYQVICGNVGTVCDTDKIEEARRAYNQYVNKSRQGAGRCGGESVTLMEEGHPQWEHQGYQDFFEHYSDDDAQDLLSRRRADARCHCPICREMVELVDNKAEVVVYDDGADERILLNRRCRGCGFKFKDVLRVVGVKLEDNQC